MIQMTVPKCWIETAPESSEYVRYIAPHIAPDCWFEVRGFSMVINFHGTKTQLGYNAYMQLRDKAESTLAQALSFDIKDETEMIYNIMVAEYVISGLIEKANENGE